MIKLIRAGLHRYIKSRFFICMVIINILCAVIFNRMILYDTLGILIFPGVFAQILIYSVLSSNFVGNEFNKGTIRNKIISGYTKKQILFSELIVNNIIGVILFLIHTVIFIISSYFLTNVIILNTSYSTLLLITFDVLLSNIVFITLFVIISYYIPSRSISIAVHIFTIIFMMIISINIHLKLIEEKYIAEYSYLTYNGVVVYNEKELEELSLYAKQAILNVRETYIGETPNPDYIDGIKRDYYIACYNLLPYAQISDIEDLYHEMYTSFYNNTEQNNGNISITKDDINMLRTHLIYDFIEIVGISLIGIVFANKKHIK